ncbi:MAG: protease modulator HflK [Myxococcota bacterium]
MLAALAAYAASGISIVDSNEVGLVLRFERLLPSKTNAQVHSPGIVYTLPPPIDRVLKMRADRIDSLRLTELGQETGGYALTGDQNIIQVDILVRYRLSSVAAFAFNSAAPVDVLRAVTLESATRAVGASRLDDLLRGGRDAFTRTVAADAQKRLDGLDVGIEIVSIEVKDLSPPTAVVADFDSVQSAFIEAQTSEREATRYAAQRLPAARADAEAGISEARAYSAQVIADATSRASAFRALLSAHRADPELLRARLYREGMERTLGNVRSLRFVPPPRNGRYPSHRFSVPYADRSPPSTSVDGDAK